MLFAARFALVPLVSIALGASVLSAQGTRDLTTPAARLVGHWALIPGDSTDFYFGPPDAAGTGQIVQVSRRADATPRRRQYVVARQAPSGYELALTITLENGTVRRDSDRVLVSKDGQNLTWTTSYEEPIRVRAVVRLIYVDAAPPPAP